MYQIKISMTNGFIHSYESEDSYYVESLRQHMSYKYLIEINDDKSGEKLFINPDHVIAISISEVKDDD